jgi:hypothetical protein
MFDLIKFCQFCDSTTCLNEGKEYFFLTSVLKLKPSEIYVCKLHLIQRVLEYIIGLAATTKPKDKEILVDNIKKLPYCSGFQFKKKKEEVVNEYKNFLKTNAIEREKAEQIKGNACVIILSNYDKIFIGTENEKDYTRILKKFATIVGFINLPTDSITKSTQKKLKTLVNEFSNEMEQVFGKENLKSPYVHIIKFHLVHEIDKLKKKNLSLSMICNEGLEHLHSDNSLLVERGVNKSLSVIKQIFYWIWRQKLLSLHLELKENNKKINRKGVVNKSKQTLTEYAEEYQIKKNNKN